MYTLENIMDYQDQSSSSQYGGQPSLEKMGSAGPTPYPSFETGPSRLWHMVSVGLFILGVFVLPYLLIGESVHQFFSTISAFEGEPFRVPGKHTFELEQPGKYIIWNDVSTVFDGQRYLFPDELATEITVIVIGEDQQQRIPVEDATGASERGPTTTRYSLFSFEIDNPGTYTVIVKNLGANRIFTLRPSISAGIFDFLVSTGKRLMAAVLSFFLGLIVPLLLSIFIEVRRKQNQKALEAQHMWMMNEGYQNSEQHWTQDGS